jgi:hypothetical protein
MPAAAASSMAPKARPVLPDRPVLAGFRLAFSPFIPIGSSPGLPSRPHRNMPEDPAFRTRTMDKTWTTVSMGKRTYPS